jgi:hypothetical protein
LQLQPTEDEQMSKTPSNCREIQPADTSKTQILQAAAGGYKAVIDGDNCRHRGFDKATRQPRAQNEMDVLGLARALRAKGIDGGTICQNRPFTAMAQHIFRGLGFEAVSVGENCDEAAIRVCERYAAEGASRLALVTGDEDFLALVKSLQCRSVKVDIFALTQRCSKRLREAADTFTAIDPYFRPPANDIRSNERCSLGAS